MLWSCLIANLHLSLDVSFATVRYAAVDVNMLSGKGRVGAFCPAWAHKMCVIAGDIGTSPLYVMSSTFYANDGAPRPSTDDVVGVTSLIVWTITWIVVCLLADALLCFLMRVVVNICAECEGGITFRKSTSLICMEC